MFMKFIILIAFLSISSFSFSQPDKDSVRLSKIDNSSFNEYYPIHEKPSFSYLSNMNSYENILFDAKPLVYYSIYNDMRKKMENTIYKPSYAAYLAFQPHFRMYQEKSKPVKTPSYKLLLGFQSLVKTKSDNFFAYAIESGHYSNGQSGCAFDEELIDGTAACQDSYSKINDQSDLAFLLNRKTGNFSTNLTKLSISYRFNRFKHNNNKPFNAIEFSASWINYHNKMFGLIDKGGFSDSEIKIYGRNRLGAGVLIMYDFLDKVRYTIAVNTEYIHNAHPFIDPWRTEATFSIYPWDRDIGFFVSGIIGHDNYNIRFIDRGKQFNVGLTWDWFAPFEIKRAQQLMKIKE